MVAAALAALLLLACRGSDRSNTPDDRAAEPTEAASSPSPSPPPTNITLTVSGDVLIHEGVAIRASRNAGGGGNAFGGRFDFSPMFERVRPAVEGSDLAICHMETPISPDNQSLAYYPRFWVPTEIAPAIAGGGFDVCTTASNHSIDKGPDGLISTLNVLDAARLPHSGTGRSPEEAAAPATFDIRGLKVAVLSYTYGLNGLRLPAGQEWMVNMIQPDRILADAQAARAAGAEFVIVAFHWGTEYVRAPNSQQTSLAQQLLPSPDVDLIIGHHAHVVQPIAKVGEEFVVYGMGNFISRQTSHCCPPETQDGVMVHVVVEESAGGAVVKQVTYTPTWVQPGTFRILPVAESLADPSTTAGERRELEVSWQRTTEAINSLGADAQGVLPSRTP